MAHGGWSLLKLTSPGDHGAAGAMCDHWLGWVPMPPRFAWRACVVGVQYVILVLGCMCVLQALSEHAVIPTALCVLVDLLAIATLPFGLVPAALGMHQSDAH